MRRCVLLLVVVVCAGCGSSHAQHGSVTAAELPSAVLQRADLAGFEQFAAGAQVRSDAHAGPRNDATRFGRTAGWIARYRRVETAQTGPLVVESRADLFPSAGDAAKDLDAYEAEYAQQEGSKPVNAPDIGEESHAFAFGSGSDNFVLVAWRDANATASVLVEGFSVTTNDAVRLARVQEKHLAKAAAD